MKHMDMLARMARAIDIDPTTLAEPWPPRSIAYPAEVAPEPEEGGEGEI